METRWLYTTSENFPALCEESKGVCVIPMGCVEKHGLHLPLGTDIIQASRVAYMASQIETVCVFPDFTFGDIPTARPNFPAGSIMLPMDTEVLLLEQLCTQIARNGFHKIIIYNGHGGNVSWLDAFLRRAENKPHDYELAVFGINAEGVKTLGGILKKQGSGSIPELTKEDEELILRYYDGSFVDEHGSFGETAFILGTAPESVHMERLGVVSGKNLRLTTKFREAGLKIRDGGWDINFPNAMAGDDPVGCNERIGKAFLRIEAERAAAAYKVMKDDEDLLRWHNEGWNSDL